MPLNQGIMPPFSPPAPCIGVVAVEIWHVCVMGLFVHKWLLMLECLQDWGSHQLVRY